MAKHEQFVNHRLYNSVTGFIAVEPEASRSQSSLHRKAAAKQDIWQSVCFGLEFSKNSKLLWKLAWYQHGVYGFCNDLFQNQITARERAFDY
jgi:hypothetical protein